MPVFEQMVDSRNDDSVIDCNETASQEESSWSVATCADTQWNTLVTFVERPIDEQMLAV
jgi:hypothetical protein